MDIVFVCLFLFLFPLPVFTRSILFPLWVQWRHADRSVGERGGGSQGETDLSQLYIWEGESINSWGFVFVSFL